MNTINLPVTSAAASKAPAGLAQPAADDGADFSATLQAVGQPGKGKAQAGLTTLSKATAGATDAAAPTLFGRLQAAQLLPGHGPLGDATGAPSATKPDTDTDADTSAINPLAVAIHGSLPATATAAPATTATTDTLQATDATRVAGHAAGSKGKGKGQAGAAPLAGTLADQTTPKNAATTAQAPAPTLANGADGSIPHASRHQLQQGQHALAAATQAATGPNTGPAPSVAALNQAAAANAAGGIGNLNHTITSHTAPDNHGNNPALVGLSASTATGHVAAAAAKAQPLPPGAILHAPIGSGAWQQELGQQMVRMTQRGQTQMELHVHPRDLGPLQISLRLEHQSAHAQFLVNHAQVRDAVQQAIPQLREALAGQGIALGEAMVGQQQQNPQQQANDAHRPASRRSVAAVGSTEIDHSAAPRAGTTHTLRLRPGTGVDLYA